MEILSVIVTLVVIYVLYLLLYSYCLKQVIKAYEDAHLAGKSPLIMLGALWFTFYEDYDYKALPHYIQSVGFGVTEKNCRVVFFRHKPVRV